MFIKRYRCVKLSFCLKTLGFLVYTNTKVNLRVMIISNTNLQAIRNVYGYLNSSEEIFANQAIVCMSASYYATHYTANGDEFSQPMKDVLCLLIARTGKVYFEPVYSNFDDQTFMMNFVEYCLKYDYETALQNLLFYCQRRIPNFEEVFQRHIMENFSKCPKDF